MVFSPLRMLMLMLTATVERDMKQIHFHYSLQLFSLSKLMNIRTLQRAITWLWCCAGTMETN